jgi:hypothetical protein
MKKKLKYVTIAMTFLLLSCKKHDFVEFIIRDISQPMYFIDSVSALHGIQHNNVSVIITGDVDSSARIDYASYPKNHGAGFYEITKGRVEIKSQWDYYSGDTIWIKFTPKGTQKGFLKIKTRIN